MKIRSIKIQNHYVLGDLYFDFTDKNNKPVNTIIIAGENGTGKSLLLSMIYEFSNHSIDRNKRDEKRIFEIILSQEEINIIKTSQNQQEVFIKDNIIKLEFDYSIQNWDQVKITYRNLDNIERQFPGALFNSDEIRKILRTIFSDVEINFTPNEINSVTSKDLDRDLLRSVKSNPQLATEIIQLLIDIQTLDSYEFTEWSRTNRTFDHQKLDVRMSRFTNAFNFMFPTKKYKKIINDNNRKKIIFEEYGKEIPIESFSSGEKQIVFRGCFLLKDKNSSKGSIILIDEPEISMHPKWQMKIINYFKLLFRDANGEQTSQLIIVTHSPFILHNSSRYDDKIFVLQKNSEGKINIVDDPSFFSWTNEEIIKKAFDVNYFKSNIEKTTVFVEGDTDEQYFHKALEVFQRNDINFNIKWIGRMIDDDRVEFSGDTALNQTREFILANPQMITSKVLLLYDNDTNKPEENYDKLIVKCMPYNVSNELYKIGIENHLNIPSNFSKGNFYSRKTKKDRYGAEKIIENLDKRKLCNWICKDISSTEQKEYLHNINNLIDELNRILSTN